MKIELSPLEIRQLIIWAKNTIEGGHFGDGNVVFPEEEVTLYKLEHSEDGQVEVTERDLNILKIWSENAIGQSLHGMTSEEISVVSKLKKAIDDINK